jgi:hypothetical protein
MNHLFINHFVKYFKAVEKDGSSTLEDLEDIQGDILSATTNASTLDNVQVKKGQEGNEESGATDSIVLDGKVVSSSDVILMKKKIDDLELVNVDREKRIQEVCVAVVVYIYIYIYTLMVLL